MCGTVAKDQSYKFMYRNKNIKNIKNIYKFIAEKKKKKLRL